MKTFLLAALVALALPASAAATGPSLLPPGSHPIIPPSNAGADQYVESMPTASGNRSAIGIPGSSSGPSSSGPSSSGPTSSAALPSTSASTLSKHGADGRRTAILASSTAPPVRHERSVGTTGGVSAPSAGSGEAPASAVAKALTGVGSHAPLLLVLLLVSLAAAGGLGIWRTRHR